MSRCGASLLQIRNISRAPAELDHARAGRAVLLKAPSALRGGNPLYVIRERLQKERVLHWRVPACRDKGALQGQPAPAKACPWSGWTSAARPAIPPGWQEHDRTTLLVMQKGRCLDLRMGDGDTPPPTWTDDASFVTMEKVV